MAQNTKNEAASRELSEFILKHGRICVGFTHAFYGPLRSLNFILEDNNPEYIESFLSNSQRWQRMAIQIYLKTGLAVIPQVLPWEIVERAETPPKSFNTFRMAEAHILNLLSKNPDVQKDPWFYRRGII